MSKQALGLGLAKAARKLAEKLGGTATILFGADDAELVLDSTSGKYVAPNSPTALDVPITPISVRRVAAASNVDERGTTNAANVVDADFSGKIPGNVFPGRLPTPNVDSIVFNGETFRIVDVAPNYVQNVLVDSVVSASRK